METHRLVKTFLICGALVLGSCGGGGSSGIPAQGAQESFNWAGYVLTGAPATFNSASATWIVPGVSCGADDTASSSWVGIGGGNTTDQTLVQTGSEQDCVGGQAQYDAWWEVIPAPSVSTGALDPTAYPVAAGDQISGSVDGSSLVVWDITIHNDTRGWTFNTTVPYSSAGATAEWIEEAPLATGSSGAAQATLANFGRVAFSAARANGAPAGLDLSDRVVMTDPNGNVIANTSAPDGGDAFEVCYGSGSC